MSVTFTLEEMQAEAGLSSRSMFFRFLKWAGLTPVSHGRRTKDSKNGYDAQAFREKLAAFKDNRAAMISPKDHITPAVAAEKYKRHGVTVSILQHWEKECPGRDGGLDVFFEDTTVIIERDGKRVPQVWPDAKHYDRSQVKAAVEAWRKMPRVRGEARPLRRRGKDSPRKPRKCRAPATVKSKDGRIFRVIKPGLVKDQDGGLWASQTAAFVDDGVNDQALRAWAKKGWVDTVPIQRVGFGREPYPTYFRRDEPRGYMAIKGLQAGKNRRVAWPSDTQPTESRGSKGNPVEQNGAPAAPSPAEVQTGNAQQVPSALPVLTSSQQALLDRLYDFSAFQPAMRFAVYDLAEGWDFSIDTVTKAATFLKKLGLLECKHGREGGYWLTEEGKRVVEASRQ